MFHSNSCIDPKYIIIWHRIFPLSFIANQDHNSQFQIPISLFKVAQHILFICVNRFDDFALHGPPSVDNFQLSYEQRWLSTEKKLEVKKGKLRKVMAGPCFSSSYNNNFLFIHFFYDIHLFWYDHITTFLTTRKLRLWVGFYFHGPRVYSSWALLNSQWIWVQNPYIRQ